MAKLSCPTIGCKAEVISAEALRRHLRKPHVACSCGWAGTRLHQHLGQVKRRVHEGRDDPGEGIHDEIMMEFDADLGRWVRISKPAGT